MLRNGLNTCGIATTICGFFNLFPYAAFAQNVGLIGLTGVRSRFVVSVSGIILILMGVFSRMAALVVLIPKPILGGAGIVMFGMVAVSGIRTLGQVNYRNNNNGMVVALTLGPRHDAGAGAQSVYPVSADGSAVSAQRDYDWHPDGYRRQPHPQRRVPFRVNHETPVPDPAPPSSAARNMAVRTVRMWLLLRKVQKERQPEEAQEG